LDYYYLYSIRLLHRHREDFYLGGVGRISALFKK